MSNESGQGPDPMRARRMRNLALGLFLGFLVVLFFVMTLVRIGGQLALQP